MIRSATPRALRRALQRAGSSGSASPFSSSSSAAATSIPAAVALIPSPSSSLSSSSSLASSRSSSSSVLRQHSVPHPSRRSLHSSTSLGSAWPVGASAGEVEGESSSSTSSAVPSSSSSSASGSGSANGNGSSSSTSQDRRPIDLTDAGSSRGTRQKLEMPKSKAVKSLMDLRDMKKKGKAIACLTAYDYPTALSLRRSDIDICLVGDSMANVALGHASTQSLSLDATIHHCQAVYRGLFSPVLSMSPDTPGAPILIVDLPFGTFHDSVEQGVQTAVRLLKEGGADGVKIEGGKEILPLVRRLTQFGIPVMGHLGLQPQRVASTAGYRLQGRTADEASLILEEALALQEAGAFSIVLECIPNKIGELVSQQLERTVTIGIGAGPMCDGQILVTNDLLGELTSPWHVVLGLEETGKSTTTTTTAAELLPRLHPSAPKGPKFVRNFAEVALQSMSKSNSSSSSTSSSGSSDLAATAGAGAFGLGALRLAAVEAYVQAVRERSFPDPEREGYKIKGDELREFVRRLEGMKNVKN
ncbi:hypothetical protein BCV69DRAFT_161974 [Microstroma glucosiphilum]|uniref:3-methyl-2-oxobutanoate hydroxymethyltransferase n=1 Tax=Pseudomicrostroma glucosiphilum TaxID=1684307 RepID=A0A316UAY3_9BASI|nr:hypothetical protein BCV69DRAFT_161974 [Pseudomicrostroma glucosiphilum]PWN22004.1 hypothetical protein BCV69DRAFT_161974 [Pseudomicrostroma glucosiphilum]